MKWSHPILMVCVAVGLGLGACSKEPEPQAPTQTEAEIAAEQEAARRSEETATLASRAGELSGAIEQLGGGGEGLPESLQATLGQVGEARAGVERLVGELEQATGDGWEEARSRLDAALSDLESARDRAAKAIEEWRGRESEVVAARESGGSPVNPATGLIEGLDGGQYEQYKPSVIERVQEHLRAAGRYAGPADGTLCKPTMAALGDYQKEQELQVSGVPSPMTRWKLFSDES